MARYSEEQRRAAVRVFHEHVARGMSKEDAKARTCTECEVSPASLARFRRAVDGPSPDYRPRYSAEQRAAARARFEELLAGGVPIQEAEAQVTRELGVSAPSLRRFRKQGDPAPVAPHGNRKLLDEHLEKVIEWATEDPTISVYELTQRVARELGLEVHEGTLQRALHGRGIKKQRLRRERRAARLAQGEKPVRVGYTEHHRRRPPEHPHRRGYPSDLSDEQWSILEPLLQERGAGQPEKYRLRDIIDAILYQTRAGCAWRYLPHDLPSWQTVMRYQQAWTRRGLLDEIHAELVRLVRVEAGRNAEPKVAIVDAQTVKSADVSEKVAFDGHKKLNGRKRTIVTDTLGLVLGVALTAANVHDAKAAVELVNRDFAVRFPSIEVISADLGYQGSFQRSVDADPEQPYRIDIVRRPDGGTGGVWTHPADHTVVSPPTADRPFPILRRRWVIERTNGWNMKHRRLRIDYERQAETSRARVLIASTARCLGRLGRDP